MLSMAACRLDCFLCTELKLLLSASLYVSYLQLLDVVLLTSNLLRQAGGGGMGEHCR
jgi:hypothetical protein